MDDLAAPLASFRGDGDDSFDLPLFDFSFALPQHGSPEREAVDEAAAAFAAMRNSTKTLKCPKCNWHYKYQETLEIHMKEKHADSDVKCQFCVDNRSHPKLARGETYSCGYKPYRCELCKYSTTTKGNLSIHMQSDKHLHAMQDLPRSLGGLPCVERQAPSSSVEDEGALQCAVCGVFSSDSLEEMVLHVERERNRTSPSDVSFFSGVFRCHLCPYNSNLKANFQLHTRTDKHLQRVQLVSHIREAPSLSPSAVFQRLHSLKALVQVRCAPCNELLTCVSSLREHCASSSHAGRAELSQLLECRLCPFQTLSRPAALEHMTCHDADSWQPSLNGTRDEEAVEEEDDGVFACASCAFTSREKATVEEHEKSHDGHHGCPLCPQNVEDVADHLVQEHKIAEEALPRLLAIQPTADDAVPATKLFPERCTICGLSFRTEQRLQAHSLSHAFKASLPCSKCSQLFATAGLLRKHQRQEHPDTPPELKVFLFLFLEKEMQKRVDLRCEVCSETFEERASHMAHLNSVSHLHNAKRLLEQQASVLDLPAQVLAALQKPPSPSSKPFRCNVCRTSYGQGTTLDIHLRSVAHQSRMSRLSELVSTGEVDPSKAFVEQPGGPTQKTIAQLVDIDGSEASDDQQKSALAMLNMLNMAQLFAPQTSSLGEDEESRRAPRTGVAFRRMLESYGADLVKHFTESGEQLLGRVDSLPDEAVPEMARVDCSTCEQSFSSIWVLKAHHEEVHHSPVPPEAVQAFAERLRKALEDLDEGPAEKKPRLQTPPRPRKNSPQSAAPPAGDLQAQMALLGMMGFPFMGPNPFLPMMGDFFPGMTPPLMPSSGHSPQKRARTRITDDQLKILRQYFDINNSPSEQQIKEMSVKAGLPEKVIKHWFRNTLFKVRLSRQEHFEVQERQRDKDSPYNFSVPPQMSIDLDMYEKTGEAKVTPLKEEPLEQAVAVTAPPTAPPPPPPAFPSFLQDDKTFSSLLGGASLPSTSTTSGRRANRTRFTDFQLRTLQQFFDKQAYPKDDDLEMLSKKLQLSPRVIVVWFQNARQKVRLPRAEEGTLQARKIYENQPNSDAQERFVKTPGCNFQCKRCQLVFQRYYELIQHQQKNCYKDDGAALLSDNKAVEDALSEEEKAALDKTPSTPATATAETRVDNGAASSGGDKKRVFYKRCPFCCLLFHSRDSLAEHIPAKHAEQSRRTPILIDLLPDAADVPTLSVPLDTAGALTSHVIKTEVTGVVPLDLSSNGTFDLLGRESMSISPFMGTSDNEENEVRGSPSSPSASSNRSPAQNAKRYRTHLTPMQVHVSLLSPSQSLQVMKCVFADYKTPSMNECEMLGAEIGLHKRVVQVWFQNARAKERKTKACNGSSPSIDSQSSVTGEEETPSRSASRCTLCDVEYSSRSTLQDHLFTSLHLNALKASQRDSAESLLPLENSEDASRLRMKAVRDRKNLRTTPLSNGNPMKNLAAQFPYNLMMQPGLPMMYDPNVIGTPIPLLQIPEVVQTSISADLSQGEPWTRFSQDGLGLDSLKEELGEEDAKCVRAKDETVGWACRTCTHVFQLEALLKNHQRLVCTSSDPDATSFKLIQTHYECAACNLKFGNQKEFKTHTETSAHRRAREAFSSSNPVSVVVDNLLSD